jgi:hypothetical protein
MSDGHRTAITWLIIIAAAAVVFDSVAAHYWPAKPCVQIGEFTCVTP